MYYPENIKRFMEDQAFSLSYDLAPNHPLLPPPGQQARPATHTRDKLLPREVGENGWGTKTYDGEKAWSSLNRSILSGSTFLVILIHSFTCMWPFSPVLLSMQPPIIQKYSDSRAIFLSVYFAYCIFLSVTSHFIFLHVLPIWTFLHYPKVRIYVPSIPALCFI